MSEQQPLIDLRQLSVSYQAGRETVLALREVSLTIRPGETVAIVGESGSGKTTLANALLGLLPGNARISAGELRVNGQDYSHASERQRRALRGSTLGLVPQDPMVSLNPTQRIGRQIGEALCLGKGGRYRSVDQEVLALLEQVGIDRPALRARQYPHELSGGMRQRVLIAIALAGDPQLIIADEPTSALDVTVQQRILDHLEQLVHERGIALLIITHDLSVAAERADRLLVMHNGQVVEQGPARQVVARPAQPYTRQLLAAAPAFAMPREARPVRQGEPLLKMEAVSKAYALPRIKGQLASFQALREMSLVLHAGETLGIVGESGSGKSTTLRLALGLEQPDSGQVWVAGQNVSRYSWRQFRPLRRQIQLVQQNPFAALDPRLTVFESIVEPLLAFGIARGVALEHAAQRLIEQVHLPVHFLDRLPHELSGGQRQRVAIARALALAPKVLLLDEPVSALDVSVQRQILDLLAELQREVGIACVIVSHDLAVVAQLADRVMVMRQGEVVEQGPSGQVFGQPAHPYTQALLEAVPGRQVSAQVA